MYASKETHTMTGRGCDFLSDGHFSDSDSRAAARGLCAQCHATDRILAGVRKDRIMACRSGVRVFSRKTLLLFLLVVSSHDYSAQAGRSLILVPGVSLPLCFSAQSRGSGLPDPGLFLSLLSSQELVDPLCDFFMCKMLFICLLGVLKYLCRNTMYVLIGHCKYIF